MLTLHLVKSIPGQLKKKKKKRSCQNTIIQRWGITKKIKLKEILAQTPNEVLSTGTFGLWVPAAVQEGSQIPWDAGAGRTHSDPGDRDSLPRNQRVLTQLWKCWPLTWGSLRPLPWPSAGPASGWWLPPSPPRPGAQKQEESGINHGVTRGRAPRGLGCWWMSLMGSEDTGIWI